MVARLGLFGLNGGSVAVGGSICAHGVAFAVGLRFAAAGAGGPHAAPVVDRLVDVDVVTPVVAEIPVPAEPPIERHLASPPPPSAPPAARAASAPVRDSAPHATRGATDGSPTPKEAAPALTADDPLPSFDLTSGNAAGQPHGVVATNGSPSPEPRAEVVEGPLPEHLVSTPARLARGGTPLYPSAARADGIEGDVVLQLVLSASGSVDSVRVTKGIGHGLDEAAVAAVKGYRFSPATKDGRAVGVRMRWVVNFRLE